MHAYISLKNNDLLKAYLLSALPDGYDFGQKPKSVFAHVSNLMGYFCETFPVSEFVDSKLMANGLFYRLDRGLPLATAEYLILFVTFVEMHEYYRDRVLLNFSVYLPNEV